GAGTPRSFRRATVRAEAGPVPVPAERQTTGGAAGGRALREAPSPVGSRLPAAPRRRRAAPARAQDATNRSAASPKRDEAPARRRAPACRASLAFLRSPRFYLALVEPPRRNGCAGGEFPSFWQ